MQENGIIKSSHLYIKMRQNLLFLTCTGTWKGMNDDTAQLTIAFKNEQELCDFIAFFNPKELKKIIDFQKQGGLFH